MAANITFVDAFSAIKFELESPVDKESSSLEKTEIYLNKKERIKARNNFDKRFEPDSKGMLESFFGVDLGIGI